MSIAIIGSGYVGLPLAIEFSKKFKVISYDINKKRIERLKKGFDDNKQHFKKEILNKNLDFTNQINEIAKQKYFIITVPTPINQQNQPDLSFLKKSTIAVAKFISKGSIVIYESTTYPGCTDEICIPLLEKYSKLLNNKDFFVAYSPERVNPGDKTHTLQTITKVVGSNNPKITTIVKKLYQTICKKIYTTSSIKIAESAKVIENIQRDVNIALINELSVIFNKLKIPTNEVLKAASTKWNFHYYKPGLVGGHCIGIDPYYLAFKAQQKNYFPQLILSGRHINENMGKYIATQTLQLLSKKKIPNNKAKIAILGFSFKENIPDFRNTKVIHIIHELKKWNVKLEIFDSHVSKEEVKEKYGISISKSQDINKKNFDAIILAVSHKEFIKKLSYYDALFKNKNKKILIDIKNNFLEKDLIKKNYNFFQL
jgi:UDP-N-acetyl-D-galactosamine dehydrogenase